MEGFLGGKLFVVGATDDDLLGGSKSVLDVYKDETEHVVGKAFAYKGKLRHRVLLCVMRWRVTNCLRVVADCCEPRERASGVS